MGEISVDQERIEEIAARMNLRQPNKEALESVAYELSQHYDVAGKVDTFEAVVDSATGVGKTYIIASAIDYLAAANGTRNFAIISPGKTILNKTIKNFTNGNSRSLLPSMESAIVVVTAENFCTTEMGAFLADDSKIKLFIFTVQSILRPTGKINRATRKFQETLGAALYDHLKTLPDLVVFADEHHCYFGESFSAAIRELTPRALIGLTATPHSSTPSNSIIYRYPLAAAIADRFVKTPVIVGRKDDLNDDTTKLADGLHLLQLKQLCINSYVQETSSIPISAIMLIVARDIREAEAYSAVLESREFEGGRWNGKTLTIHSDAPDDALASLERIEEPTSTTKIIISVGMLKEGWDVKNVYVIASMRASVSSILTEQTLGRGLRLPWGRYTGIEMLDTLEVLAHERYEDLLKKAGLLKESFIDQRTRAILRMDEAGKFVAEIETSQEKPTISELELSYSGPALPEIVNWKLDGSQPEPASPSIVMLEDRIVAAEAALPQEPEIFKARPGSPEIYLPRMRMSEITSHFSLADITDLDPFIKLAKRIAVDPDNELRRMKVSAKIIIGRDGLRRTELVTSDAADQVPAALTLLPMIEINRKLTDALLAAPMVPGRKEERAAAATIITAFLDSFGASAERVLTGYLDRASARLVSLVQVEAKKYLPRPKYQEVIELSLLEGQRTAARSKTSNLTGKFSKSLAYNSWQKSMFEYDWFDSSTELTIAMSIDSDPDVSVWLRLHNKDLSIVWNSEGREYNADFIVLEKNGDHFIVEGKMNKEMTSTDVRAKRDAAKRWANHVNASGKTAGKWSYILVSEDDVKDAKGSWRALKGLGSG